MKLPLSLIQSFIRLELPPLQIAETLTLLGLEVDKIEPLHPSSHPNTTEPEIVFEISLTPNLGHCMSALGVARELSAALQIPLLTSEVVTSFPTPSKKFNKEVQINPNFCPRYMSRLIEGVSIGNSPLWLQKQLRACGLEPIWNAVDIANYILLKRGQPFHVFDANRLKGSTIRVELSNAPHKFLGLDGVEREIPLGTGLVSDASGPVAIAGILGGNDSAVTEKTTSLLIEAAIFDPTMIRQTTQKMGLRTDSSQRFERGVDPNGTPDALDEVSALILELCGGRDAGMIDCKFSSFTAKNIDCRLRQVNRLLGMHLSLTEIQEIFNRLGFDSEERKQEVLCVHVPLFRSDISEEIDLIEEIARIYGYHRIEKPVPLYSTSHLPDDPQYLFEKEVRKRLIALGLQEFLNADLISKKLAKLALEWIRPGASLLTAVHAKTEEHSVLRPSLLPGLLETAKVNFNQKTHTLSAFEIGRVHFLQNDQLVEEPMVALILSGKNRPSHWSGQKNLDSDFFDLKGYVESLFEALKIPSPVLHSTSHLSFHPGRQADIHCDGLRIGAFGEVHPKLLERSDIKQPIFYAEINLHLLMQRPRLSVHMKPLPHLPSSERDWTVPLAMSLPIDTLFRAIRASHSLLLEKAELIDLYIPETSDQKNATFRFTYRDPLKTISFEEVENAHAKLTDFIKRSIANF